MGVQYLVHNVHTENCTEREKELGKTVFQFSWSFTYTHVSVVRLCNVVGLPVKLQWCSVVIMLSARTNSSVSWDREQLKLWCLCEVCNYCCRVMTLGKLFTHMWLCYEAVWLIKSGGKQPALRTVVDKYISSFLVFLSICLQCFSLCACFFPDCCVCFFVLCHVLKTVSCAEV